MSKFVTLVLEPRFEDGYGEYANLPVFNAHGDVVGYTGGEVPETGNPCEFYVMDEEGFPVCHSASENARLHAELTDLRLGSCPSCGVKVENERLRELVRELYEDQCCDGDQWKYRDRLRELGIEVDE